MYEGKLCSYSVKNMRINNRVIITFKFCYGFPGGHRGSWKGRVLYPPFLFLLVLSFNRLQTTLIHRLCIYLFFCLRFSFFLFFSKDSQYFALYAPSIPFSEKCYRYREYIRRYLKTRHHAPFYIHLSSSLKCSRTCYFLL